jgi:hypothetical protein
MINKYIKYKNKYLIIKGGSEKNGDEFVHLDKQQIEIEIKEEEKKEEKAKFVHVDKEEEEKQNIE